MREFTDSKGRVWKADVNVLTVSTCREETGFIVPELFDNQCAALVRLSTDYEKLVDVLWYICTPGIDARDFASGMGGDALRNGMEALVRSTADFFTYQEQREAYHKLADTIFLAAERMSELAAMPIMTTLKEIDINQVAQKSLDSALNGPASLASSRGHSLPANSG